MELKMLLWQTIIVFLVIFFVDQNVETDGDINWSILILPCAILILSISMAIIQKYEKHAD